MFNNNASAELIQRDNFLICTGSTPQHSCDVFHGVSNEPPRQLISKVLGDVAAAGQSSTVNLVNISDDVAFLIAGTVHVSRTGQASGFTGSYDFVASRDQTGSRHVSVGDSSIKAGTRVQMAFEGDTLQLTLDEFEYGYLTVTEQVDGHPRLFAWEPSVFAGVGMQRV